MKHVILRLEVEVEATNDRVVELIRRDLEGTIRRTCLAAKNVASGILADSDVPG